MNTLAGERERIQLDRPGLLRDQAYIHGVWTTSSDRLEVINPATGAAIGSVPHLGARHAEKAVSAAHDALPRWAGRPAQQRAAILRRWADLIRANAGDLARIITSEQGKPLAEATAEVGSTAAYVEWFAEEARRVYGDTIPGPSTDKKLMVLRQPVGVVAAITPWNFPAAMIARKAAPALAVGCTMVLKPSEFTPLSALALAVLAEEAGVPRGVINVVSGDAEAIGKVLTTDTRVAKLSFTGSTHVGKMLAARCASTVKRVSLELGGNAPFIVFEDADIEQAIEAAMVAKFRNSGQTCVCANRFYVQDGVHERFADALARRVAALRPGNGLDERTNLGPLINTEAYAKVTRHLEDACAGGGRVLTGGSPDGTGLFFPATVLADVAPDALLCREETFGPLAGIVRFRDEEEVLELANDSRSGLAAYVFTHDLTRSWRMIDALEYGMVGINTGLMTTEAAPFGGIKESGLGREGSRYGIDDYVELKTVCIDIGRPA